MTSPRKHEVRNRVALAAAAVLLFSTAAIAQKKELRYTVGQGATVSVNNNSGSITVRPGSGAQVIVEATARSSKVEVDGAQSGNRVDLRTHFLQPATGEDARVDYDIQVPSGTNIVVHTAAGPVSVHDLKGDISVDGDNASVAVRDVAGNNLRVRTIGGPITLAGLSTGYLEATSVGGAISVNGVASKLLSINTTTGAINYSGDFAGAGEYSLSSHSGNIDVAIPANASVDITARTVSGSVENDFPFQPQPHPTMSLAQGKSFGGVSNSGASSVRLRTFSGRIRVKKQ
ncbi:MAG: DUF4097 family beta strand repeat-containing protein [Terriglobales bacterium]